MGVVLVNLYKDGITSSRSGLIIMNFFQIHYPCHAKYRHNRYIVRFMTSVVFHFDNIVLEIAMCNLIGTRARKCANDVLMPDPLG